MKRTKKTIKKKGLNTFGKKSSTIGGKRGGCVVPWKLHNPSIYRGSHSTPVVTMEKSPYSEKARRKHRKHLITL